MPHFLPNDPERAPGSRSIAGLIQYDMGDQYKKTIGKREGPRITHNEKQIHVQDIEATDQHYPEYGERIETSIRQALKEYGGSGETYTDDQKKLMIWYTGSRECPVKIC